MTTALLWLAGFVIGAGAAHYNYHQGLKEGRRQGLRQALLHRPAWTPGEPYRPDTR